MKRGFTLVELMIVAAIIGILAAVMLPAFQRAAAKQKSTAGSAATPLPYQPRQVPESEAAPEAVEWCKSLTADVELGLRSDGTVVWRRHSGYGK